MAKIPQSSLDIGQDIGRVPGFFVRGISTQLPKQRNPRMLKNIGAVSHTAQRYLQEKAMTSRLKRGKNIGSYGARAKHDPGYLNKATILAARPPMANIDRPRQKWRHRSIAPRM